MAENHDIERQKWDDLYGALALTDEPAETLIFNQEFLQKVQQLLPEGGRTLEAGCGAGWQSMALARSGQFDVNLLDFSEKALQFAQANFQRVGLPAHFELGDAFESASAEFDLVFNAGVLEHYSFEQQVKLVRAMASRSRKYVLVLIPNRQCYWYWLWRVQKSAQHVWPFGREVPEADLSKVFEAAGLRSPVQTFLGAAWTENFIAGVDGLDEDTRQMMLQVHRSGLVPPSQAGYLLAILGRIDLPLAPDELPGWERPLTVLEPSLAGLQSTLADTAAINIALARKVELLDANQQTTRLSEVQQLAAQHETVLQKLAHLDTWLDEKNALLAQQQAQLAQKDAQIARIEDQFARLQAQLTAWEVELGHKNSEIALKWADFQNQLLRKEIAGQHELASKEAVHRQELASKEAAYQEQKSLVDEIRGSNAWKLVQLIWRTKVFLRTLRLAPAQPPPAAAPAPQAPTLPPVAPPAPPPAQPDLAPPTVPPPAFDQLSLFAIQTSPDADRRVAMITYRFFDYDGNNMFFGGAERYLVELAQIIRQMGYEPEIWQCGNSFWVRYYRDLKVIGLNAGGDIYFFKDLINACRPAARMLIFSPFSVLERHPSVTSIGISHGVYWDHESFQGAVVSLDHTLTLLKKAFDASDWIVSVDTNTINWVRAIYRQAAAKFNYIPNFVDIEEFHPVEKDDQQIVVLYPRRLYNPRGFYLAVEILPELLEKYPRLCFHFVGKADPEDDACARQLVERFPGRVQYHFLPMDRMHEAYQQADIAIIPTLHSEGTSLSCLEALASGNAVVATNVGGLPDLILHGHNGLLIEPNAQALKEALVTLIEDPVLRRRLGQNGREVAQAFTLDRWGKKWREVLARYLPPLEPVSPPAPRPALVFNAAPGIFWDGVKQRPHHLAYQFAANGIDTYWTNPNPAGRQPDPVHGLHILAEQDDLYLERPFYFVYYPFCYEHLQRYDRPRVIYDILDDISIHDNPADPQAGRRARYYHEQLLKTAEIVLVSSRQLLESVRRQRPDVIYVPNGVDLKHFNPQTVSPTCKLDAFTRPIIGYHGAVATWFDGKLFAETARLRPNYDFVVVGPVSDPDVNALLDSQPNIHKLGLIPYEDLPPYVARFDVGTMPFILTPLTHAVRPLKLLEYMALNKPVVATPLAELADWPGVLLAATPEEFAARLDEALQCGGVVGDPDRVRQFLQESSWHEVARELVARLKP